MEINISDIRNKEFSSALRGYNKKEVREFLHALAGVVEELSSKNKQLSEEVAKFQKRLTDYQLKKEELDKLLILAQKKAEMLLKQSEEKAHFTLREAQIKVKKIQEEENKKIEALQREVKRLSNQKSLLLRKIKAFLRSQEELLKFYEEEKDIPEENSFRPLSSPPSRKKIILEED
ncbi:hypothetical protein DRJ04_09325 [Candidatus Aerophobetes bacterium]|uniref:DivIVA domain-containing protein n=1 Tax=Aerophobetes bacterium TaxID=2030807 RepID=A0A662D4A7_UNCAE|nr:MAG: hypothetical protein DRJ04_09325 [Candidatus Aerophobetes bacterium]